MWQKTYNNQIILDVNKKSIIINNKEIHRKYLLKK